MNYIGRWVFHSIGIFGDDGLVYYNAEDFMTSPMLYIEENDTEAVADENKERKNIIGTVVKVCDDGKLYMLMPIPEGVSKEDVDAAAAMGEIKLCDGMLYENYIAWEDRDGELWYDTGIEGEAFGEMTESWEKAIDDEGFFVLMNIRFVKAD